MHQLKTAHCLLLLLLCFSQAFSQTSGTFDTGRERYDFLLKISKKYNPDGVFILENLPADQKETHGNYAGNATTALQVISNYSTVVHESLHDYDMRNRTSDSMLYFIGPGLEVRVPFGLHYNSKVLAAYIPAEIKENIGRYETYIGLDNGMGETASHVYGIYGLLEEFNAYHHGAKAAFAVRKWFGENYTWKEFEPWVSNYLIQAGNDVVALNQFRYFIAKYLEYADKREPAIYKDCLANTELRSAFTLIDSEFQKTIGDYPSEVKQMCENFNAAGLDVEFDGESILKFESGTHANGSTWRNGSGNGTFIEQQAFGEKAITPTLQKYLDRFKLDSDSKTVSQSRF